MEIEPWFLGLFLFRFAIVLASKLTVQGTLVI